MSHPGRSPRPGVVLSLASCAVIAVALAGAIGLLPHLGVITELAGLLAVFVAPGLAIEPNLHVQRWTALERLGLVAAFSIATSGLAGVGLSLIGQPVTTPSMLLILLLVAGVASAASMRQRPAMVRHIGVSSRARTDVSVAALSLALLAAGIGAVLIWGSRPAGPALEVAVLDGGGNLIVMPIQLPGDGGTVEVGVRSQGQPTSETLMSLSGTAVEAWSVRGFAVSGEWTVIALPVHPTEVGVRTALLKVTAGAVTIEMPIALEVSR